MAQLVTLIGQESDLPHLWFMFVFLQEEFNKEWSALGGQLPYLPPSSRGASIKT